PARQRRRSPPETAGRVLPQPPPGANAMADLFPKLLAKIEAKAARVGILGLGYVGLPLASAFARNGVAVLGFDVDAAKVEKLQHGTSYIKHITDEMVAAMRKNRFEATDKF